MSYDALSCITIEREAGVVWASIDFPPMNLLGAQLFGELAALTRALESDADARVLVLRSAAAAARTISLLEHAVLRVVLGQRVQDLSLGRHPVESRLQLSNSFAHPNLLCRRMPAGCGLACDTGVDAGAPIGNRDCVRDSCPSGWLSTCRRGRGDRPPEAFRTAGGTSG